MNEPKDDKDLTVAVVRSKVLFHDLDMMQVVWHGNYFKYFGEARLALFAQAGLESLYQPDAQAQWLYPVVRSEVKHVAPLRFMDEFTVTARLREARYKIVIDFEIRKQPEDKVCTRATTQQVAISAKDYSLCFSIPDEIRRGFGLE